MVDRYNDYYRLTEGYLRNYRDLQMTMAVMMKTRSDAVAELTNVKIPIAQYGDPVHGGEPLTHPEGGAERSILLQQDLWVLNRDIESVGGQLQKIGYALSVLSDQERECVRIRFFERKAWPEVESEARLCERQAQRICGSAVWRICNILFHHRQDQRQRFIFAS